MRSRRGVSELPEVRRQARLSRDVIVENVARRGGTVVEAIEESGLKPLQVKAMAAVRGLRFSDWVPVHLEGAVAERDRRRAIPDTRDLTGRIFGDPLSWRSAFAKRAQA